MKRSDNNAGCPECGGSIDINGFEQVCSSCGLVLGEILQESSFFFSKNKGSSFRQAISIGDSIDFIGNLGSFIGHKKGRKFKDISGKVLNPEAQKIFSRFKKNYQLFSRTKDRETEFRVFNSLKKVVQLLDLPRTVRKDSAYYFRKILKEDKKIINHISLIGFCIYFSIKNNPKIPVTVQDIVSAFESLGHRLSTRLLYRDALEYGHILKKGNIRAHISEDFIPKFISDIRNSSGLKARLRLKDSIWDVNQFTRKLKRRSLTILSKVSLIERGGRNPEIFATAVIYIADLSLAEQFCTMRVLTQGFISEVTGIPQYSLRDHYVNVLKPKFGIG